MSELKPCPEYQEEMNELLRMKKQLLGPQGCSCQSQQRNDWKAHCLSAGIYALSQLQRRAQPANEPLTLEQLREMQGEPVWTVGVSYTDDGSWSMWDIIEDVGDEGITFGYSTEHCDWWNYNLRGADGKLCGCAWLAYRRKPERSENECTTN